MQIFPKILTVSIALPPYTRTTEEILPYVAQWIRHLPERQQRKILRIFQYAQVDRRYSIMDIEEVFAPRSFEEKNDFFIEKSIDLAEEALRKALDQAQLRPQDLDFIITTSCTGFMIPSIDAYLINRMSMKQDIVRLPVTEMGCAAGTSALIYAHDFLKAHPNKYAAVIAVESPTSTFQHHNFSMTNIVSAAIFGDGAACAILGPGDTLGPVILDREMYHFYDAIDMMGYKVRNTGFEMVLDVTVPERIQKHFPDIIYSFLEKNHLGLDQLDHLIFHPGGKKILQMVDELFGQMGKNIEDSKAVLSDYGNMSSATVLYVLARFLQKSIPEGEHGLMLSFGPGFSAQRILLRWEH